VNTWVWHKVGLELGKIDVQCTIETKGGSKRRHDLGNQTVKIGVGWALYVKVAAAHIVQGLVIKTEGAISMLEKSVRGQHVIVWLYNCGGYLRSWGDGERKLGLSAVVDRQTLK
jgi:hypothetical protein